MTSSRHRAGPKVAPRSQLQIFGCWRLMEKFYKGFGEIASAEEGDSGRLRETHREAQRRMDDQFPRLFN
jgi:hypothetical protein